MSLFNINLTETIYYLSDALSLVGNQHVDHGKRVAFMAVECARALGWNERQTVSLFLSAILHDCGVSKTATYQRMMSFEGVNAGNHCTRGAELLRRCHSLVDLSECIQHHHVAWHELKGIDLPDQVKQAANCINMLDMVDFLALYYQQEEKNILLYKEVIRKKIATDKNRVYDPKLVDIFLQVSSADIFWLWLDQGVGPGYFKSFLTHKATSRVSFAELRSLAAIYAQIVDEKSYYTKWHSVGVANFSRCLGELFGLPEYRCDQLELAGLLHDLGKLRVPDYILEKPGELTETEFLIMKRHSFDSYNILKDINGFHNIARWAAEHHERLDGSGYPFHYQGDQIALESRMLALADVFQSYTQDRPHRERLSSEDILILLQREVLAGKLDEACVLMLEKNLEYCLDAVNYKG